MSEQQQAYRPIRRWEYKTSNLTTQQRREARAYLIGRFGQKKEWFTGDPIEPRLLHKVYDLHHLLELGTPGCNYLINLRLAYHGYNSKDGKPKKSTIQTRDKDRISPPIDPTVQLRQIVPYDQGSPEMKANTEAEPKYRALMWEFLIANNRMTKKEAIYGMAERVGVSPQATRDYLEKMISEAGPFKELKDENGVKWIIIKPERLKEF